MRGGGLALKSLQWFLRIVEFCCAVIILGIFSYFLAALHSHNLGTATYIRAVEGIAGAAVLYTIIGILLLCCLAGIAFFSFVAMLLDLAFTGAFIYVAWATRGGRSCTGIVNTPLGSGNVATNTRIGAGTNGSVRLPSLRTACRLNTACFAVAIVAIVFFFLSIFVEFALYRHHKKEKAFGPSPNNGYTAGSPRRKFWQRKPKRDAEYLAAGGLAAEKPDALPMHSQPTDVRHSYATEAPMVGGRTGAADPGYGAGAGGYASHDGYKAASPTHPQHGYGHATDMPPANYRGSGVQQGYPGNNAY